MVFSGAVKLHPFARGLMGLEHSPKRDLLDFDKFPTARAKSMVLLADLRRTWPSLARLFDFRCRMCYQIRPKANGPISKNARTWRGSLEDCVEEARPYSTLRRGACTGYALCATLPKRWPKKFHREGSCDRWVRKLAAQGIKHNDLKWEHVAFFAMPTGNSEPFYLTWQTAKHLRKRRQKPP